MNNLIDLKGAKLLTKKEQKSINGGFTFVRIHLTYALLIIAAIRILGDVISAPPKMKGLRAD